MGAFGSPADCGLAVPPVGPLPTLLEPEAWARISPSLSADACAASGKAKAAATPTASNVLSFITVSWLNERRISPGLASPRFTANTVPVGALR
jgi:hypothetical protein